MNKISEQYIGVPGGAIFVKRWMPRSTLSEVPVLLLHDSLGCVEMWRDYPRLLSEKIGRTIIAYDRLGFGRSTARDALPSVRFVSEESEIYLAPLFDNLGIERFTAFGHSVGGAMSVVCAGTFGDRCESVITESAQAFVEDRTRQGIIDAKKSFEDAKVFEKLKKYHGNKTQWVLDAWIKVWLSREFASWSLKDDLPKMRCPVLAIHGDNDEYGSVKFPEMICALAGGTAEKKIISNCGHVPHREKLDLVLDLIAKFLENQQRQS